MIFSGALLQNSPPFWNSEFLCSIPFEISVYFPIAVTSPLHIYKKHSQKGLKCKIILYFIMTECIVAISYSCCQNRLTEFCCWTLLMHVRCSSNFRFCFRGMKFQLSHETRDVLTSRVLSKQTWIPRTCLTRALLIHKSTIDVSTKGSKNIDENCWRNRFTFGVYSASEVTGEINSFF